MNPQDILDQLIEAARHTDAPDDLASDNAPRTLPELFTQAHNAFGSWDRALARALCQSAEASSRPRRSSSPAAQAPRPPRIPSPDRGRPMLLLTAEGHLLQLPLDQLQVTSSPEWLELPPGPAAAGHAVRLLAASDDASLALFTNRGNGFRLDLRLVQPWTPEADLRPLNYRYRDAHPDERVAYAMILRDIRDHQRIHFLTHLGQIKISDCSEYRGLDSSATVAVILRDDSLAAAFAGPARRLHILVAASTAKAIHFETTDIRSQGRKAGGVRAIALDDDAHVVGVFPTTDVAEIALVTANGFTKRMSIDEFRPQGRAGGGLQTCRLADDDEVVAVAPIDPAGDVFILTDRGRYMRFPAWDLPLLARAARGEQLAQPDDGERICDLVGVPAGELPDDESHGT